MHYHKIGSAILLLLVLTIASSIGCTPRVVVRANPTAHDKGVRYYRPKPYLKIEPAEIVTKSEAKIVPSFVKISLVYMPDFSEEYSINVRSGFGTADVGIKLEDGWNLTEISQDLDSQTDENLEAIGSIISAIGDIQPTSGGGRNPETVSFTVPAYNVPIGFYESVIGRDSQGCKRLYGFRYLGFLPYSGCPVDMGGNQRACCGDLGNPLYGLTFIDGQMAFQPLDVIATTPIKTAEQSQADTQSTASDVNQDGADRENRPVTTGRANGAIAVALRSYLIQSYDEIGTVEFEPTQDRVVVKIVVPTNFSADPVRELADRWLLKNGNAGIEYSVEIIP